jgi:DNA-binding transcriptional LysR family regulator
MPSCDDFRIVKAMDDCKSFGEAAKAPAINQSTVFRNLGRIERRLGARLMQLAER